MIIPLVLSYRRTEIKYFMAPVMGKQFSSTTPIKGEYFYLRDRIVFARIRIIRVQLEVTTLKFSDFFTDSQPAMNPPV